MRRKAGTKSKWQRTVPLHGGIVLLSPGTMTRATGSETGAHVSPAAAGAAWCGSSRVAPVNANVLTSSGSPVRVPPTWVSAWQDARRDTKQGGSSSREVMSRGENRGPGDPEVLRTGLMHASSRPSDVSVPVLSKQKQFTCGIKIIVEGVGDNLCIGEEDGRPPRLLTFPARLIRGGDMQTILNRRRAIRA